MLPQDETTLGGAKLGEVTLGGSKSFELEGRVDEEGRVGEATTGEVIVGEATAVGGATVGGWVTIAVEKGWRTSSIVKFGIRQGSSYLHCYM